MKKYKLDVDRYEVENDTGDKYYIYVIPEDKVEINFYIQKVGYGLITHEIGLTKENFNSFNQSIEDFIAENSDEWIDSCEYTIQKLESEEM